MRLPENGQWQVTRNRALRAEVGDPLHQRLKERPMECDTRIPRFRRPIAVEDDQTGDENSYSVTPGHPGGIAFSDCEKAEALADSLESQFQTINDPLSRR